MNALFLPRSTPYDPAEDPPGSVDPLGTATGADQLAEVLLPGLTARMWRARLLTFAGVSALVAKRVAAGREGVFLDARLAFERLFVSAMARQEAKQDSDDPGWSGATQRLPGVRLAHQALRAADQPLGPANFLKGQAANGPFGVISRLARVVGVIDEAGELGRGGIDLVTTWSREQGLPGLLDDGVRDEGGRWLRTVARKVEAHLDDSSDWPSAGWPEWEGIAHRLRPDAAGLRERAVIRRLVTDDPLGLRTRVIGRLESPVVFAAYKAAYPGSRRGELERTVLVQGLRPAGRSGDELDRTIVVTVDLIDAYEEVSGLLESAFRCLLWGLTRRGGHARPSDVLGQPAVGNIVSKTRSGLVKATGRLRDALVAFEADPLVGRRRTVDTDRVRCLIADAGSVSASGDRCAAAVLDRHRRVQKEKEKGVWVEEDERWTLMPGFGDASEGPPGSAGYVHPFRVTNAYSLLADLDRRFKVGAVNGEAEGQY